ncbi:MAG: PH domain-containing protein [Patescibacteria group bacterium]
MEEIILKKEEKIFLKLRSTFLIIFWPSLLSLIILAVDAFFMFRLFQMGNKGIIIFTVSSLVAFVIFFRAYFLWKKNIFVITDNRIVDIERRSLVEKTVSEIYYNQIEDIAVEMKGFFASIFKYGDIILYIKKTKFKIIAPKIKNPVKIQQLLNSLKEKYLEKNEKIVGDDLINFFIEKIAELESPELKELKRIIDKKLEKIDFE